jgi:hypothetical protein
LCFLFYSYSAEFAEIPDVDDERPMKKPRTADEHGAGRIEVTGSDQCLGTALGFNRFTASADVYALLTSATSATVLPDVPRGRKVDCYFLIDNSANVQRKASKLSNRFWDDCGVWDSTKGRNLSTVFIRAGTSLREVKHHDGQYCVKKQVNKQTKWQPVDPQPNSDAIVVMYSYYSTLKACDKYRKRVSWCESHPNVALAEYIGAPPTEHEPHGSARVNASEYVRTKPHVIDSMRAALQHRQRSKQVYEDHVVDGDSFEVPRDHKQVRNLAQVVNKVDGGGCGGGSRNVANDYQKILNGVQDNPFIQHFALSKGRSPVVIAYLPEQLKDMQRFCKKDTPTALRTVLGVDRTFNLGPCFVTTIVYKNMSVVRKSTNDHPIFLGPIMLHFDAKTDTYVSFFSHLSTALGLPDVHTELLDDSSTVFGSDEEKAIVNAIRSVFHASGIFN